jgi:hypothetical protein
MLPGGSNVWYRQDVPGLVPGMPAIGLDRWGASRAKIAMGLAIPKQKIKKGKRHETS